MFHSEKADQTKYTPERGWGPCGDWGGSAAERYTGRAAREQSIVKGGVYLYPDGANYTRLEHYLPLRSHNIAASTHLKHLLHNFVPHILWVTLAIVASSARFRSAGRAFHSVEPSASTRRLGQLGMSKAGTLRLVRLVVAKAKSPADALHAIHQQIRRCEGVTFQLSSLTLGVDGGDITEVCSSFHRQRLSSIPAAFACEGRRWSRH